jgi:hypothetical protein
MPLRFDVSYMVVISLNSLNSSVTSARNAHKQKKCRYRSAVSCWHGKKLSHRHLLSVDRTSQKRCIIARYKNNRTPPTLVASSGISRAYNEKLQYITHVSRMDSKSWTGAVLAR